MHNFRVTFFPGCKRKGTCTTSGWRFFLSAKGTNTETILWRKANDRKWEKAHWRRFTLCWGNHKGKLYFQAYRKMTLKDRCNTAWAGYFAQMRTCSRKARLLTDLACINRYMTTSDSAPSAMIERQLEMLYCLHRKQIPSSQPWTQQSLIGYV